MQLSGNTHICRAYGCNWRINEEFLMCYKHWRMIPAPLQAAIYATVPKRGTLPSLDYAQAVRAAVLEVKRIEYPHTFAVEDVPADEGSQNADN